MIIKKRNSIKTFELILPSLSFADLLVGVSGLLMAIYHITHKKIIILQQADVLSYVIFGAMVFAVSSSITNILAINSDRLLAVKYPLKHKVWMSPLKAKPIIVIIWLASIITAVGMTVSEIRHVESGHNSFSSGFIYNRLVAIVICGVTSTVIYAYIILRVMFQRDQLNKKVNANRVEQVASFKHVNRKQKDERTLVLTSCLVVFAYLGRTFPFAVIPIFNGDVRITLQNIIILIFINSTLDPFIYFLKGYLEKRLANQVKKRGAADITSTRDLHGSI